MTNIPRRRRRIRRMHRAKTVYVHDYRRFRFGRWEDVRHHYRSLPQPQLVFDFGED